MVFATYYDLQIEYVSTTSEFEASKRQISLLLVYHYIFQVYNLEKVQ